MDWDSFLPPLVLLSSLVPGILIFLLREEQQTARTVLNLAGAIVKVVLVGVMLWGVYGGHTYTFRLPFLPGLDLTLRADPLPLFFVTLSAVLWLLTTVYAIGYLEGSPHRSRFFGCFSLSVTATVGIALAGDLLTFLLFYEMLTVTTYPLVVHRGHEPAMRAGNIYLVYTLVGGAVLLGAIAWLYSLTGTLEFAERGFVAQAGAEHRGALIAVFVLLIAGFGVKAALFPLHSWLPRAMIAPAPVSALLHAVAVVKAGVYGIVRVLTDVYGIEFAQRLGLLEPLAVLASVTIVYGSIQALRQEDLKKRLAFSTVSQASYIVLGLAIASPLSTMGGILHLVHQGIMKITLFFCAGILAETLHIHRISEMKGVGQRLPWTMLAFTVAALGMIGVPPVAGFVTKWYLGLGSLRAGEPWVVGVLLVSTLLNAAYFLPVLYSVWFQRPTGSWTAEHSSGPAEAPSWLLWPTLTTAGLSLFAGLFANGRFSPLYWATIITQREWSMDTRWMVTDALFEPGLLWITALGLPVLAAGLISTGRCRAAAAQLAPWTLLPLLGLACFAETDSAQEASWLLLNVRLGIDEMTRVFLFFTALLWLLAGIYAHRYLTPAGGLTRFMAWYLLAAAGNLGLILARDVTSFYLFFALMSYSSFVLIVHDRTAESLRAGTVYMVMVVLNEALLLAALWLAANAADSVLFADLAAAVAASPARGLIVALALVGLGIKAGVLVVHVWLPLAHPVAPTPASAVLSGAMIKAGVIGWLRLLPLGVISFPAAGTACVVAGLLGVFYAALVGVTQRSSKTILAYSSVSQMGFVTLTVGLGLLTPAAWPAVLLAVLVYAMHHALAKGSLFLGVGVAAASPRSGRIFLVAAGLILAALVLAGAPGTSGAVAKSALVAAALESPGVWGDVIIRLLPWGAVATTLLMARFLQVLWQETRAAAAHEHAGLSAPWAVALAAAVLAVPLWPWNRFTAEVPELLPMSAYKFWSSVWPILVGTGLFAAGCLVRAGNRLPIPAGDVLVVFEWFAALLRPALRRLAEVDVLAGLRRAAPWFRSAPRSAAPGLTLTTSATRSTIVGVSFLVILILLTMTLWG